MINLGLNVKYVMEFLNIESIWAHINNSQKTKENRIIAKEVEVKTPFLKKYHSEFYSNYKKY